MMGDKLNGYGIPGQARDDVAGVEGWIFGEKA